MAMSLPEGRVLAAVVLEHVATLTLPRTSARAGLPVAVTAAGGQVCVTDATTSSACLYDEHSILTFHTSEISGLADPNDVTVESAGTLVCTDAVVGGGRTIRRLNFFGESVPYVPEPPISDWRPDHLLVTADGNYVTSDGAHSLLVKHDSRTGAVVWKQALDADEASGETIGLGRPAEAPDGELYVPLGGDRHIGVYSKDGAPESTFGVPGTGRGHLSFPVGVAFCPDGSIAVLDRLRHTILLYNNAHAFIAEFGEYGTGPRNLYHPLSIAATADGRVYVTQGLEARIHVFRFSNTGSACLSTDQACPTSAGSVATVQPFIGARTGVPELASEEPTRPAAGARMKNQR